MSKVLQRFFLLLFFSLGIFSCENEVDISADWKEIMVVYGLLDPLDSAQYIKINKAFLNEKQSAYTAAKEPDSLYLKDAQVHLEHINTGQIIALQRVDEVSKQPGVFANSPNYLYKTTEAILENEPYRLVVESKESKQKAESVTWTLRAARIEAPFKSSNPIFSLGSRFIVMSYVPGRNAHAYDIKMGVTVDEYNKADTSFRETKELRWNVITNFVVPKNSTAAVLHQIERESFMQFLVNSLDSNQKQVVRRIKRVSVEFYGASQNLVDYISVNEPSIGIVQKTAEYSNINGGMGLFGSRCKQEIGTNSIEPATITLLQNTKITAPLNFIR
jgi:hypothetical protein